MGKIRKHATHGAGLQRRAANAARPSIEALLLAAVALGCAQIGWSVMSPNSAHGSADPTNGDDPNTTQATLDDIRSPFSPEGMIDGASHAAAATLANMRVSGLRMADDPSASGVILTLEGGDQRAFRIGQEVTAGVTIRDVQSDFVVISYEGGERQLPVESAQRFSYADALMGRAQEAPAPQDVYMLNEEPQGDQAPAETPA